MKRLMDQHEQVLEPDDKLRGEVVRGTKTGRNLNGGCRGEPHVRPSRRCETVQVNGGRVRYARNGTVRLAYRVFGEAENTVVWTPGSARNVESFDDPASPFATSAKQLSQVTRLVVWDMRGGGLSDAATQVPPLTERIEDLRTVMNAAGVESATMFGFSEGGATSVLFAATYPQRVRSLVVYGRTRGDTGKPHCSRPLGRLGHGLRTPRSAPTQGPARGHRLLPREQTVTTGSPQIRDTWIAQLNRQSVVCRASPQRF
jgi:pimeloyl-ACP methyl ester carboxylesterase